MSQDPKMRWIAKKAVASGITRPALAAKLGLSESTVLRAFRDSCGIRGIRRLTVAKYAEAVGFKRRGIRALFDELTAGDLEAGTKLMQSTLTRMIRIHPKKVLDLNAGATQKTNKQILRDILLASEVGGDDLDRYLKEIFARLDPPNALEKEAADAMFMLAMSLRDFGLSDAVAGDYARSIVETMQTKGLIKSASLYLRQLDRDAWAAAVGGQLSADERHVIFALNGVEK